MLSPARLVQVQPNPKKESCDTLRIITMIIGLILIILKISAFIVLINWLMYPSFAASLIIWALADSILIFGAWAKSHILLQIWTSLSLVIVGVSFAVKGFWPVTVFVLIYVLALIFVINLVRNFNQEPKRSEQISSHMEQTPSRQTTRRTTMAVLV